MANMATKMATKNRQNPQEIAETVERPVFATFPCDYADIQKSIRAGQPSASLAASMLKFSELVLNKKSLDESKPDKRRRFVEYFALARGGMRI